MDNLIYILFVSIFVPILLMACLVEKKARQPIIFVLIGIFLSVFASEVNAYLRNILLMSPFEVTIIVTPISEEILKALRYSFSQRSSHLKKKHFLPHPWQSVSVLLFWKTPSTC
jgi:RsiW-degrading membrane proteinase PrsW (M82 family)